jgi:hypothetical protein
LFPPGDGPPHQALFASIRAGLPRLWVLGLDHLADPLAQVAPTQIALDKPVHDVVAVPGKSLAMITARAGASLGTQRVSLRVADGPSSQSGSGWGAMAQASAAVDLFATSRPPFGIGLRAELGYVAARGVGMTLHRDAPGPSSPLGTTDLMLGHLDLGGRSFAVSQLGQF